MYMNICISPLYICLSKIVNGIVLSCISKINILGATEVYIQKTCYHPGLCNSSFASSVCEVGFIEKNTDLERI